MARMEKIEGCDERALLLTDTHLQAMRWGAVEENGTVPLTDLAQGKVIRDDKGKLLGLFGKPEERVRLDFGRLILAIWVPLERRDEAEAFVAKVNDASAAVQGS
jgi:hypothetical protein